MAEFAIAIHHSPEFGQILRLGITSALPGLKVHEARNLDDGWNLLGLHGLANCRIIVSGLRVPRSQSSEVPALDGSERTSLDLVSRIRSREKKLQANVDEKDLKWVPVLLVAAENSASDDLSAFKNVNVACVTDIALRAPELIRAMLGMEGRRRQWRNVNLDIMLHDKSYLWHLRRSEPYHQNHGPLDIQPAALDRLRDLSAIGFDSLPNAKFLSGLGRSLYEVVMGADADGVVLKERLKLLCDGHGGIQGARIRFSVDKHTYPILLELVTEPSHQKDKDFWMLQAPLFRSCHGTDLQPPLFTDRDSRSRKLNCLLIQGDTQAFRSEKLGYDFPQVNQTAQEISDVVLCLRRLPVDTLRVVRYSNRKSWNGARTFRDAVRAELASRPWDLVHYAGHSYAAEGYSEGWIVFGSKDNDVVRASDFAGWVGKSRFVFLSSCESAGAEFVLQTIEWAVPAIVGFRWPIGDSPAKLFATNFYKYLLDDAEVDRHLEYAFFKAKQALHEAYPKGPPVWASPVLVMQGEPAAPN